MVYFAFQCNNLVACISSDLIISKIRMSCQSNYLEWLSSIFIIETIVMISIVIWAPKKQKMVYFTFQCNNLVACTSSDLIISKVRISSQSNYLELLSSIFIIEVIVMITIVIWAPQAKNGIFHLLVQQSCSLYFIRFDHFKDQNLFLK